MPVVEQALWRTRTFLQERYTEWQRRRFKIGKLLEDKKLLEWEWFKLQWKKCVFFVYDNLFLGCSDRRFFWPCCMWWVSAFPGDKWVN